MATFTYRRRTVQRHSRDALRGSAVSEAAQVRIVCFQQKLFVFYLEAIAFDTLYSTRSLQERSQ